MGGPRRRLERGDHTAEFPEDPGHPCGERGRAVITGGGTGRQLHDRPVGEHDLGRDDSTADGTMPEKPAARRIPADHPADRGRDGIAWVGAEDPPAAGKMPVELGGHHARLHPHAVGARLDDPPHEPRAVDHDPGAERPAGEARSGAPRMHRYAPVGRPADRCRHVLGGPRPHHRERPDLEQAAVGGVERPADVVADHVARDDAPQIFLDSLPLEIHAALRRRRSGRW